MFSGICVDVVFYVSLEQVIFLIWL